MPAAVLGKGNLGGYPSGQRGLTVNQMAEAFGGSNPSPPTRAGEILQYFPAPAGEQHGQAHVAQSAEHVLGKNGVMGSNPIVGSTAGKATLSDKGELENGEAEI